MIDSDDYDSLQAVIEALVSSRSPSGELERSAARLTERGYLYMDTDLNLRLSEAGDYFLVVPS